MCKKRLFALVLCIVLTLTLCSCGYAGKVKEELMGIYAGVDENFGRAVAFYENGTFYEYYENCLGMTSEKEGTWKIEKDKIYLIEADGSKEYFTYEYNKSSGKLTLYYNDYDTPYNKQKDW